jgi:hypothetical protein
MHFKLIACEAFTREICACMAEMPHVIDLEFTAIDSHDHPDTLRQSIQEKIDAVEKSGRTYDAMLLCYGLCGNATVGLVARSTQLVIPRAHDCCTILLGSKKLFSRHFEKCPSQPFYSRGHIEHHSDAHTRHLLTKSPEEQKALLADLYGEENAESLAAAMNPGCGNRLVYINVPPTESRECIQLCREKAEKENKAYIQLEGSLALIRNLMSGNWYPADFLVVKPGKTISGVYDREAVMEAVPT